MNFRKIYLEVIPFVAAGALIGDIWTWHRGKKVDAAFTLAKILLWPISIPASLCAEVYLRKTGKSLRTEIPLGILGTFVLTYGEKN